MRLKVRWLAAHDQKSHRSMADEVLVVGGALVLRWRARCDGKVRQFIVPPGSWWNASTEEIGED